MPRYFYDPRSNKCLTCHCISHVFFYYYPARISLLFFLLLLQPKFGTGGGNYGYYHSNISTGNYGNYNPAYTSSPSQVNSSTGSSSVVNNIASTTTLPNRQHNIGDSLTIPGGGANNKHVTYDNFNPNLEVAPSLNIDRVQQQQNQQHLATNRYSLHVRASPISPTYSQFSSGVSVKNAYPTPANAMNAGPGIMPGHLHSGGNGYGGGGLKNASFDYVPSDQLRNYRYSVPDNYAVYVNSTTSPLPTVVPIHEQTEVKSGSSLATHVWIYRGRPNGILNTVFVLTSFRGITSSYSLLHIARKIKIHTAPNYFEKCN